MVEFVQVELNLVDSSFILMYLNGMWVGLDFMKIFIVGKRMIGLSFIQVYWSFVYFSGVEL